MNIKYIFYSLLVLSALYFTTTGISGCAQIGMPTGGERDTIPPVLIKAEPADFTTNFKGNKIELTFNEYIDVADIQNNVLVSPYPKVNPNITFKLKTITVKLKDSLLPNTTYAINFGNALKDLNEGNPYKNYTYVFSSGDKIDSLKLNGNVLLAESGKTDSTITAMLYRDGPDSAVAHRKPDYIAKLNNQGNFNFTNLSAGTYKLYALKDGDGGKTYNSPIEVFAFADKEIVVNDTVPPVTLYAYAEEKESKKTNAPGNTNITKPPADKKLRYTSSANPSTAQGLREPLKLVFNRPLKSFDEKKILLTDTTFKQVGGVKFSLDSTNKIISLSNAWPEDVDYILIINKEAVTDTLGEQLAKSDSIRFRSKGSNDYGNLVLRFKNYDASKHPVLQFFKGEELIKSVVITSANWSDPRFEPGDYELRILYDENNNGVWDPGNYKDRKQPEKAITLPKKLTVKTRWDNERDVEL